MLNAGILQQYTMHMLFSPGSKEQYSVISILPGQLPNFDSDTQLTLSLMKGGLVSCVNLKSSWRLSICAPYSLTEVDIDR